MAAGPTVTVDSTAVLSAMAKLGDATPHAARRALALEAEAIMTNSKENFVPVDTGVLRASGFVDAVIQQGREFSVVLGFGGGAALYARAVHENPRAGKTGGVTPSGGTRRTWATHGEWKYLERPFLEAKANFATRVGERILSALRAATGK